MYRKFVIVLIIITIFAGCSQEAVKPDIAGTIQELTYMHEGVERDYMLYVPDNYREDMPLVMVLHGMMGHNYNIRTSTGFDSIAEENSFVVCYPQGLAIETRYAGMVSNRRGWNANFNYGVVDDVGFIMDLEANIKSTYSMGEDTFLMGYGNGGYLCYSLALANPGHYKAMAVVIASMSGEDWDDRSKAMPISLLQVNGLMDTEYDLYEETSEEILDYSWSGAPPIYEIMKYWAEVNGCAEPVEKDYEEGIDSVHFPAAQGEHEVVWYINRKLTHRWPSEDYFSDPTVSELIGAFFDDHKVK